jgi:hypothetical protein
MSDAPETKPNEEKDFLEQFDTHSAFLMAAMKTRGRPCPMCDVDDWRLEIAEKDGVVSPAPIFVMKDARSYWGPSPSMPAIAFTCGNCGFIRMHNLPYLLKAITPGNSDGE